MKTYLLLTNLAVITTLKSFAQQKSVQIAGSWPAQAGVQAVSLQVADNPTPVALLIRKNSFSWKAPLDSVVEASLLIKARGKEHYTSFYLEPGLLKINLANPANPVISGSELNTEAQNISKQMKAAFPWYFTQFGKDYEKAVKAKDETLRSRALYRWDTEMLHIQNWLENYVRQHPNSRVAADEVLDFHGFNTDAAALERTYKLFSPELQQTASGRRIADHIAKARRVQLGQQAPHFEVMMPDSSVRQLSDFRGKFLLLDFWASWCQPCRLENKNLVKLYPTLQPLGLEILGISIDENEAAWQKAIAADGLVWPQAIQREARDSHLYKLYNNRGIPMNFLIDPTGKIVAKGLHGIETEKKIREILTAYKN